MIEDDDTELVPRAVAATPPHRAPLELRRVARLQAGDLVGERFRIDCFAGRGGMGEVYRAIELYAQRAVALKILPWADGDVARRFAAEARALASLDHPGIVGYVADGVTADGVAYLAMEWLDGMDLASMLESAALLPANSLALAEQVARILAHAHDHGLVHRDIKPGNLFLVDGRADKVRLLDFGIARRLNAPRGTRTGAALGTPGYMAPEQARGERDIDGRADVFALGCVLFECLAGRPAFVADHPVAILAKILFEESPRLCDAVDGISDALDELVTRMLSKSAADRPTALETAEALRTIRRDTNAQPILHRTRSIPALTGSEQRLVAVMLVGQADRASSVLPNDDTLRKTQDPERNAILAAHAHRFGGRLEVMADGTILVSIAGSGAATDQAITAARCALALRRLEPEGTFVLAIGRALMSGHWPLGQAIDRAASLLDLGTARPPEHGVLLDDVAWGLLEPRFEVLEGPHGPVLKREREPDRAVRTLLGKPTPCVGRTRELATLSSIYDECVNESVARVALVVGAPGIGKSRIRAEFTAELRRRGEPTEIILGQGDPLAVGSPFGMIAPGLRRWFGILDGEAALEARAKIRTRVAADMSGTEVERVVAFLAELMGLRWPTEALPAMAAARLDPVIMGDQMRAAWEDWLGALVAKRPVVLVLEDLHWGDRASANFVDAALARLRDQPLMVLALARPDVETPLPGLWTRHEVIRIDVSGLPRRAAERLVRHVLKDDVDEGRVAEIVERAGGNAFFLEELIRAVAEGRIDLPPTLVAMVQSRLDELDPDERRLLRAGSVFGRVFWLGGAVSLLGGERHATAVGKQLEELLRRELVTRQARSRFPGQDEFSFRHALVREAAYGTLADEDRRLGHRLAGQWLEECGETDALALAEHAERADERERAAGYFTRAASQALEGNDYQAAIARAERGVQCGVEGETRGRLRLLQLQAHRWLGNLEAANAPGEEALARLRRGTDEWFLAARLLTFATSRTQRIDRLRTLAADVSDAFETFDAGIERIAALATVAFESFLELGYGEIDRWHAQLVRWATARVLSPGEEAWMNRANAVYFTRHGNYASSASGHRRAAELFVAIGDLRAACNERLNAAENLTILGRLERAREDAQDALSTSRRLGLQGIASYAMQILGTIALQAGALTEALARLDESRTIAHSLGLHPRRMGLIEWQRSRVLEAFGDLDAALAAAEASIVHLRHLPVEAHALAARAIVRLRRGEPAIALADAEAAGRLLSIHGHIEAGDGDIWLALIETRRVAGDHAGAEAALHAATSDLRERANQMGSEEAARAFLEGNIYHAQLISSASRDLR